MLKPRCDIARTSFGAMPIPMSCS